MSYAPTETEKAAPEEKEAGRRKGEREEDCCKGGGHAHGGGHGHSHWMMIACCVPMVLVAVFLLAGGAGLASLAPLLACVGMMAVMMLGMSRMHRH